MIELMDLFCIEYFLIGIVSGMIFIRWIRNLKNIVYHDLYNCRNKKFLNHSISNEIEGVEWADKGGH